MTLLRRFAFALLVLWLPSVLSASVATHGRLQARGNQIVGEHGEPVSLAGNSFFWSQWMGQFYNAKTVAWLKKDWHSTIVRVAVGVHEEDGYLQHPDENFARAIAVIDAAIAQDLYVIVDWHDHHAHRRVREATAFFEQIARRYGKRPHLIYEIFNEPMDDVTWARDVKPYAEKVIAAIRAIDPDNLIVVGTTRWSQDVDVAAADPVRDANVAYALHFYAGTHKDRLRAKAEQALRTRRESDWRRCGR